MAIPIAWGMADCRIPHRTPRRPRSVPVAQYTDCLREALRSQTVRVSITKAHWQLNERTRKNTIATRTNTATKVAHAIR